MLTELCNELRNWFIRDESDKHFGTFTVGGASVAPSDFLTENQYFRIVGSIFNDGVYKYDSDLDLTQEEFNGSIWAMSIPSEVIELAADITSWVNSYQNEVVKPFTSESFGGYSYTKQAAGELSWKSAFYPRLRRWRKL